MRFLPLVLIKRKLLRMSPERARPEISEWKVDDIVGGEYSWDYGNFQGINNSGRIVFRNYNGLNQIALWRGTNQSLRRRRKAAADERMQEELAASLRAPQRPRPVDWRKTDDPSYTPGQWVN